MKQHIKEALNGFNKEQMQKRITDLIVKTLKEATTASLFTTRTTWNNRIFTFKDIKMKLSDRMTLKDRRLSFSVYDIEFTPVSVMAKKQPDYFFTGSVGGDYFKERLKKLFFLNIDDITVTMSHHGCGSSTFGINRQDCEL